MKYNVIKNHISVVSHAFLRAHGRMICAKNIELPLDGFLGFQISMKYLMTVLVRGLNSTSPTVVSFVCHFCLLITALGLN